MQLYRLSGRKVCERVKTKGMLWKGKHMQARFLTGLARTMPATAAHGLYVGTLTSAKLDKSAVRRNRMRRRCREALRTRAREHTKLPAIQLLLLPRSSSLAADFGELLADADHLITSLMSGAR
jgi:ribonuclease P protein component